jgi:hypothetical protein
MSSKRRLRRKKCDGKRRFEFFAQALASIRSLARTNGARHPETLRAYLCNFCKGWHIGHRGQPSASRSALTADLRPLTSSPK